VAKVTAASLREILQRQAIQVFGLAVRASEREKKLERWTNVRRRARVTWEKGSTDMGGRGRQWSAAAVWKMAKMRRLSFMVGGNGGG
jgi:hypothetical protein